jgi:hypothetical protein
LLSRTYERDVDGVSWQSIAGDRVTRYSFALDNLKTQANGARQNNIRRKSISDGQRHNPGQPAIGSFEDHEDDQPDAEYSQTENHQPLQEAFEQSHDLVVR